MMPSASFGLFSLRQRSEGESFGQPEPKRHRLRSSLKFLIVRVWRDRAYRCPERFSQVARSSFAGSRRGLVPVMHVTGAKWLEATTSAAALTRPHWAASAIPKHRGWRGGGRAVL